MRSRVARRAPVTAALVISALVLPCRSRRPSPPTNGLEVTTPYPAVAVAPGSKVSFDLTVSSTRAADVALSLSGVPTGWTASLIGGGNVVDGVAVGAGQARHASASTSPSRPTRPTARRRIRVTARGGGAEDVLPISIRVNAEAAGDITLTTNTPTLTGASDNDVHVRPDAQERHRPGRDRLGDRDRPDRTGTSRRRSPARPGGLDGRQGRLDPEHQRHGEARRGRAGAARTRSRSRRTAGDRTIDADLSIAITGSYSA